MVEGGGGRFIDEIYNKPDPNDQQAQLVSYPSICLHENEECASEYFTFDGRSNGGT